MQKKMGTSATDPTDLATYTAELKSAADASAFNLAKATYNALTQEQKEGRNATYVRLVTLDKVVALTRQTRDA
jgi:hypothetical protein